MEAQEKYIRALIELHQGLRRQGPGDADFSRYILSLLPELPAAPRIADIGCGAGAGTLVLAQHFRTRVLAVDFSREFLDDLEVRAGQLGLDDFVEAIQCDMGSLEWPPGSIDLLWSEGAAYCITFEGALKAWRPLMASHGIAVISDMNYFTEDVPGPVAAYMQNEYPTVKTESQNADTINSSGFEVLGIHRLPTKAWWDNYYGPLRDRMTAFRNTEDAVMQSVLSDTDEEMRLFEAYEAYYGYTFYIMKAVCHPVL